MMSFGTENSFVKFAVIFGFGGFGYGLIETLYRGYTHPTMFVAGGVCFLGISRLATKAKMPFILRAFLGGGFITLVEFWFGCVFNLHLGLSVWDYSDTPYNLLGQICPQFFLVWSLVAAVGIIICDKVTKIQNDSSPASEDNLQSRI